MGCGASSTVTAPAADHVNFKHDPDLPNGHVSTTSADVRTAHRSQSFRISSNLKSNTVGPAPVTTPSSEDVHEISELGDVLTVKRILKLSSIDESQEYGAKQDASCQTSRHRWRKRLADKRSQTDVELFPEDELVLMTSDEPEPEIKSNYADFGNVNDGSDDETSYKESRSFRMTSSLVIDVFTQTIPRTCSTATQTKLSLTATAARRDFARTSVLFPCSPRRDEGHRHRAKRSPSLTTQEMCNIVAEVNPVVPSNMLPEMGTGSSFRVSAGNHRVREASVQTDIQSKHCQEAAEVSLTGSSGSENHAPRPPLSRKKEMIPSLCIFRDIDVRVHETPDREWESPAALAHYLCQDTPNELFMVRAIFVWIALNMRYDLRNKGKSMTASDVLLMREGVDAHYSALFAEMCRHQGIAVKTIRGFVKGHEYRPGYEFIEKEDEMHEWNAVQVLGSWRLIDTSLGSGFTDSSGTFNRRLNEHFFLPDPEVLIWTHFPCNQLTTHSTNWQLIEKPISLKEFNALPRVMPQFFEYNLFIRSKQEHPYEFRVQTEVQIGAQEAMRYKYKLFPADQAENESLNHFAFCQLKENRLVGSFIVTPPLVARYFLKVYAKAEREMLEGTDSSSLPSVATFLLKCTRARKYLEPYPLNELPWGPTQAFFDFKMRILNQSGPVISTWGGKRKLVIETSELMLIQHQMLDADGMEMDVRTYILKEENGQKISFTIAPPRASKFKFLLFGMPKPKQKGHWRLPLLATFLVDCKLAKIAHKDTDPPPVPIDAMPDENFANRKISRTSCT